MVLCGGQLFRVPEAVSGLVALNEPEVVVAAPGR